MVLNIEEYPKFVPWCLDAKIYEKSDKGEFVEIIADLTIGKSLFKETYKSFVVYNKLSDSIHATNISGPLKHLENKWIFKEVGKSSEVDFHVDFELKNKLLNILMVKSFNFGLKRIVNAFEKRAKDLYK